MVEIAMVSRGFKLFSSPYIDSGLAYRDAEDGNFCVVEIEIEHMTGKAGS